MIYNWNPLQIFNPRFLKNGQVNRHQNHRGCQEWSYGEFHTPPLRNAGFREKLLLTLGLFPTSESSFESTRQFDHKWGSRNEQNHQKQDFRKSLKSLKLACFQKIYPRYPSQNSQTAQKNPKVQKNDFLDLFFDRKSVFAKLMWTFCSIIFSQRCFAKLVWTFC